jgi:hypothetical protein
VKVENRHVIAWGTPSNETEYYEAGKNGFPSMSPRQFTQSCDPQTSANLNRELFMQTINPYYLNKYFSTGERGDNRIWQY